MGDQSEEVPDYMVHVKKEYLVDHKKSKSQSATTTGASAVTLSSSSDVCVSECVVELADSKASNPMEEGGEALVKSAESDQNTGGSHYGPASEIEGVKEGYKANGYKIDARDKQNASYSKKDYTGGKDPQGSKKRPRDARPGACVWRKNIIFLMPNSPNSIML